VRDKTALAPTAALVIDLARNFYAEDELTSEYVKHLDISSAQAMIDEHKRAGIYALTQELISHRKFIIQHAVLEGIRSATEDSQIVILAAGQAPLALELLSREYNRIDKVYEIDVTTLDNKQAIYRKIAPALSSKVLFLQDDIRSPALLKNLQKTGLNPALLTIFVIEGITHYMTEEELRHMLADLVSASHRQHLVVIDFGPPYDSIAPRIRPIAREAYRIIEDNCYLEPMTKHTADEMAALFQSNGGSVLHHYTAHDIEKLRTGQNQVFPEKNSGWLEYVVAYI